MSEHTKEEMAPRQAWLVTLQIRSELKNQIISECL
jgi:hypothetical protein